MARPELDGSVTGVAQVTLEWSGRRRRQEGAVLPARGGRGRGADLAGGPVLLEEAGPAELKHGHNDPAWQYSSFGKKENGERSISTRGAKFFAILALLQASSVDDDDNQGIHRHDDAPHMVQLSYNLLYRVTATVVVCAIDYNLLSCESVSYL
ncbi:uncharacterized protein LOC119282157 isoform X1 [Triticum dicoccoides]|uniref:uncharacterized protein LOC119282157 isoform X1 n=1 Tax=Triticum dicoccoides TaxID=85692 RepID=UPI00188DF8C7|nr:uncharacterized protein LOC119282157 isoform X1 [Triticum dicoccoides]